MNPMAPLKTTLRDVIFNQQLPASDRVRIVFLTRVLNDDDLVYLADQVYDRFRWQLPEPIRSRLAPPGRRLELSDLELSEARLEWVLAEMHYTLKGREAL